MALTDIYQVVHRYTQNAIECSNVYFYQHTSEGSGAPAENLLVRWYQVVFPALHALQPSFTSSNVILTVTNIRDTVDFFEDIFEGADVPGLRTLGSDLMPQFTAIQFVSNRAHPGTRAGRKRYPWLYESDTIVDELEPTFRAGAIVSAVADALEAPLTISGHIFAPVVVKKGWKFNDPLRPAVRSHFITQVQVAPKVSTQNTRKS